MWTTNVYNLRSDTQDSETYLDIKLSNEPHRLGNINIPDREKVCNSKIKQKNIAEYGYNALGEHNAGYNLEILK